MSRSNRNTNSNNSQAATSASSLTSTDLIQIENNDKNNKENDDDVSKERIILNVGGIKYETYRATLTSYPNTRLGILFDEHNKNFNRPTSGSNEYFIDRDGHMFRYILQFYRTGKVPLPNDAKGLIPVSHEDLEAELDYFMIPRHLAFPPTPTPTTTKPALTFRRKMIADDIDKFVSSLKSIIMEVAKQFRREFLLNPDFEMCIEMTFREDAKITDLNITPNTGIKSQIKSIIEPHSNVAFLILDKFGQEIGHHLETVIAGFTWSCEEKEDSGWWNFSADNGVNGSAATKMFCVRMKLKDTGFDHDDIVNNSCLASISCV
ncbi:8435_t:CDS:2 [Ambispora leptoticha]|uniref:8435_t:CDS:1 n=1 Tax=Ambispora leptoticha TaxID=144679 RepID=A0A9N9ADF1_9GLOM|nr:8435_t:CDS:2 [Ambispora leptoticha]